MFEIQEHFVPLIKVMSEKIERKANSVLKEFEVTSCQLHVLVTLVHMDNAECTLKELEKIFDFSQAAIAGVVSRLEQKGYVSGFVHRDDKRIKCIAITERGRKIAVAAQRELDAFEVQMMQGFDEKEKQVLMHLLRCIYYQIDNG